MLPFLDRSVEQDQAYFCEGMAEEVTNALARVKGLRVAARSSAFSASRRTREPREIGRAPGVGLVLDGTVRRAGTRLRVSGELVSAADGFHVWSARYDRELADVFEVQDDIAGAIAGALELPLSAGQRDRAIALLDRDVDWDAFLDGVKRQARLDLLPEAAVGDYVMVHAGLAIATVDAAAAQETLELLRKLADEVQ